MTYIGNYRRFMSRIDLRTAMQAQKQKGLQIFASSTGLQSASAWQGRIPKILVGDDKIYKHKLCIISKFRMFVINVLDIA